MRGIDPGGENLDHAIRFHPGCQFGSERFPALVSLIRNVETDDPQGIQRTALTAGGRQIKRNGKTLRMTLGIMAGGAIKIDPDEHVTLGLHIGEGVETVLSARQRPDLWLRPAWAMGGAAGIHNFPVLTGIDCLTLIGENDATNEIACKECARRWFHASKQVRRVWPKSGGDFNDILKECR